MNIKYSSIIAVVIYCILYPFCTLTAADNPQIENTNNKSSSKIKIYCAGPLFNNKEREEMLEIAQALEQSGFSVFLPHRDGMLLVELTEKFKEAGLSKNTTDQVLHRAIFSLDVYHVLDSQGLVLNMNGRVPDEGSLVEAGIAWNAGKIIVIYKTDSRTLVNGRDNSLVEGIGDFKTVSSYDEIIKAFLQKINVDNQNLKNVFSLTNANVKNVYNQGKQISQLLQQPHNSADIVNRLKEIVEGKNNN